MRIALRHCGWAGLLALLLAGAAAAQSPEPAPLEPPPVTDATAELFWCAGTFYWLMMDAFDAGEEAQGNDFDGIATRFATRANLAAAAEGMTPETIDAYGASALDQALADLEAPDGLERLAACLELDEAEVAPVTP